MYSIELIRTTSLFPADIKNLWDQIDVRQLDEKNLKFTLPEPFAPFLDYATFGVLPRHILASTSPEQLDSAEFNIHPGTGPYKFDHLIVEGGNIGECPECERPLRDEALHPAGASVTTRIPRRDAYEQGDIGVSEIRTVYFLKPSPIRAGLIHEPPPQMSPVMNTKLWKCHSRERQCAVPAPGLIALHISTILQGDAVLTDQSCRAWAH
jgi:hypothetical protein